MLYKWYETGMSEDTKNWLDCYCEKNVSEYWPHISLNCYDAKCKLPVNFKSNKLVLFHVGDGVTCRRIIYARKLK